MRVATRAFALAICWIGWQATGVLAQQHDQTDSNQSVEVQLSDVGPWTSPFTKSRRSSKYKNWKIRARTTDDARLTVEISSGRSTDYPLSVTAPWSGEVPLHVLTLAAHNTGSQNVKIGVVLTTEDDDYIRSPYQELASGAEGVLRFDMLDAKPAQAPDASAKVRRIGVYIKGIRADDLNRVSFGKLSFTGSTVTTPLELTSKKYVATAGEELQLDWPAASGSVVGQPNPVQLTIEREGHVYLQATTQARQVGRHVAIDPVTVRLPRGMPSGEYDIFADTRRLPVTGQPARRALVGSVTVGKSAVGQLIHAEVKQFNGAPAIHINGEPHSGLMYMTYHLNEDYMRPFGEAGIDLFSFDTACGYHPYNLAATSWPEAGTFDFSECDAHATRIISACPETRLLIRIYIACPPWWAEANPDECMVARRLDGTLMDYEERPGFRPGSWASHRWRRDMGDVLRRLVDHLRASTYSDRIVGLMVCAGVTEEWMMFGSNSGGLLTDYSTPARMEFRRWVRRRYGTAEKLRDAWQDPTLTFDTVEPPTPPQIEEATQDDFLSWPTGRAVADWWWFLSDLTADTIEHFARIVKVESQGNWICGAFYGYAIQFHEPRVLTAGHLAIDRLAKSQYLDYFFSPALYSHRSLKPGGYSTFMSLVDSYHLHGKLWCNENDLRTYRVLDVPNVKVEQIDRRQTFDETVALLRRQLGCVLAHGCGHSYFDMSGGWYDDPRLMEEIHTQVSVSERALEMDRAAAHEVAVVIDPEQFTRQALFTKVNTWLVLGQVASLGAMGVPFDIVTLEDIENLPRKKMWIFLNLFQPSAEQVERVHRRLRNDNAMGLFVYAAGSANGEEGMRRLTGMEIRWNRDRRSVDVKVDAPALGIHRDVIYGTSSPVGPASFGIGEISPTFHVSDPNVEVFGRDTTTGAAGLCVKPMDGWTSAYSAAPGIAPAALRGLAKKAGVHVYVDEDAVVYANNSLLSVTVVDSGKRTIRLPRRSTVEDAFTGQVLARGVTEVDVTFGERESKMFFLSGQ